MLEQDETWAEESQGDAALGDSDPSFVMERRLNYVIVDLKLAHGSEDWESIALSVKAMTNESSGGKKNAFELAYCVEFLIESN